MVNHKYSIPELVTAYVARGFREDDVAFTGMVNGDATALYGSMIPLAAMSLARHTHAPNLTILLAGRLVNPDLSRLTTVPDSEFMPELRDVPAEAVIDGYPQLFSVQRGEVTVGFCSGAQVDRHGNVNAVAIGDYRNPRSRLLGPVFQTEHMAHFRRELIMMGRHEKRNFVERVDFVSAAGYTDGQPKPDHLLGRGPVEVITPLCVFGFTDNDRTLYVKSIHPGVDRADLRARTGIDLGDLDEVPDTAPPSDEELDLLRRVVDPRRMLLPVAV